MQYENLPSVVTIEKEIVDNGNIIKTVTTTVDTYYQTKTERIARLQAKDASNDANWNSSDRNEQIAKDQKIAIELERAEIAAELLELES